MGKYAQERLSELKGEKMSDFNLRWLCWLGLHRWMISTEWDNIAQTWIYYPNVCERCGVDRI